MVYIYIFICIYIPYIYICIFIYIYLSQKFDRPQFHAESHFRLQNGNATIIECPEPHSPCTCFCCSVLQCVAVCRSIFRQCVVFLEYHVPQKDGKKKDRKRKKSQNTHNTLRTRNLSRSGIECVCLKAPCTINVKKISRY